jgi:hypothetical protein
MLKINNPLYHYLNTHLPPIRVQKNVLRIVAALTVPFWCLFMHPAILWMITQGEVLTGIIAFWAVPSLLIALIFPIGVAYIVAEVGGYLNRWVGLSEQLRLTPMTNFSIVSAFVMVTLSKMRLLLGLLSAALVVPMLYGLVTNSLNALLLACALVLLNVMAALLGIAITLRVHRPEQSAVIAGVITFGLILLLGFLYLESLSISTEHYPCRNCPNDERNVPLLITTEFCLLPLVVMIGMLGVITHRLLRRRLSGA